MTAQIIPFPRKDELPEPFCSQLKETRKELASLISDRHYAVHQQGCVTIERPCDTEEPS